MLIYDDTSAMFSFFRKRQDAPSPPPVTAAVPDGARVYAIGDIHGCADLFEALIDAIEADDAAAPPAETTIVLLGDLVDRGPDSAGVLRAARDLQARREVRILAGNHEEMFDASFDSLDTLRQFLRFGGRETLLSYGIDRRAYSRASLDELQEMMAEAVPMADRAFMKGFEDSIRIGNYVFVHAGIEPGVPLGEQDTKRLRWIREPFLSHVDPHDDLVIVHGHTITDDPEDKGNRIGVDTGAYARGRLTALVLEGKARRYISASHVDPDAPERGVAIRHDPPRPD